MHESALPLPRVPLEVLLRHHVQGRLFVVSTSAEQEKAIDADLKAAPPDGVQADGSAVFGAMRGVATVMSDPVADHCSAMFATYTPPSLAKVFAADRYSGKYVGKPVNFSGKTAEGVTIDTDQFKGKVVLIDFWASWCGPCKAELPRLKAVYDQYHAKGFEVIGVSNDYTRDALVKYLATSPLPWPSVFDPQAAADDKWNSITRQYKIESIPRMFLIDKAGILRTTEGRSQMETLVPKLLAENAEPTPAVSMNAAR